jgi:hypothetical protein
LSTDATGRTPDAKEQKHGHESSIG